MITDQFFNSFSQLVENHNNITILAHLNPDGDALGSTLALHLFLNKLGKKSTILLPNDFPSSFNFLPNASDIVIFYQNTQKGSEILKNSDLFCFLDFNDTSRTGLINKELELYPQTPKILIDHHLNPDTTQFAAVLSDTLISSTSELVAQLIQRYGFEKYLDENIAKCLLTGIMTDTGSFSYSIFNPNTFQLCSQLLLPSIDYNTLHRQIFDCYSENRLRLLGFSLNKMQVIPECHTAFIVLCADELERFDFQVGDSEGIVNYPLSIKDINMSVLVKETQGQIRFSFRSKGQFSVHELAKAHFNGGGHKNAAGGTLDCTIIQAREKLLSTIPLYKDELNY